MKSKATHRQNELQTEKARSRTSSEVLAILASTPEEPEAVLRSFIWKTGPQVAPESGSA